MRRATAPLRAGPARPATPNSKKLKILGEKPISLPREAGVPRDDDTKKRSEPGVGFVPDDDVPFLTPDLPGSPESQAQQGPAPSPETSADGTLSYLNVMRPEADARSPLSEPLVFTPDERETARADDEPFVDALAVPPPRTTNPGLERSLDQIRGQIETIARLGKSENLSKDQVTVLRRYLDLKEQEARDLRDQLQQVQGYVRRVQEEAERSKRNSHSVTDELEQLRATNEQLREDLRRADERLAGELAMLKNEYEDRLRRSGNVDAAAQEFYRQRDEWKERVREELKRIKLKERELENRHELLKRDMQALLDSKDRHVLELKKKNDALELEMETLEDRLRKANVVLGNIEAKKRRLVETMRLSMALLEAIDRTDGRPEGRPDGRTDGRIEGAADADGDGEKKRRSG
jgi:hypothetical protein